jgi:hypothetical protein
VDPDSLEMLDPDPDSLNPDPFNPDPLNPDPDPLNTDPDPAFQVNPDPVPDLDPNSGFWWPKMTKKIKLKKIIFFKSKIAIYLSLGLHNGRPSYRRSLQPSKENSQHFKKWNFLPFLSFFAFNFVTLLFFLYTFLARGVFNFVT